MEGEAWTLTARLLGGAAQKDRVSIWSKWYQEMMHALPRIKQESWKNHQRLAPVRVASGASCGRSSGHVEKVRLPTFSGKSDEYAEFRVQF